MSKSFHGAELNWKTQDYECGAIYKALNEKFQNLLFYRHFLLETNNKNLTILITATSSTRVYRWKLAIQRYAFNIRHVVGELNVVADAFLRCVFDNHSTKAYPIQAVATMNEIVLTDEQCNTIGQFHNSIYCRTRGNRPDSKANAQSRDFVALLT